MRACLQLLAALAGAVLGSNALAYTGGPVRAHVEGFDPVESRVYYHLVAYDEMGYVPQLYYLSLNGPTPTVAVRDESLEALETPQGRKGNPRWHELVQRLVRLEAVTEFEVTLGVTSSTDGMDPEYGSEILELSISVESAGESAALEVTAYCRPVVGVRAMYAVPNRAEHLVVMSYIGRA